MGQVHGPDSDDLTRSRGSLELYRAIFLGAAEGYLLIGDRILDCNPRAAQMLGTEPQALIGLDLADISPPTQSGGHPSASLMAQRRIAVRAGEDAFFFWQFKRRDGSILDAETWLKRLHDSPESPLLAAFRDVRNSLRLTAELARAQAELRQLYEKTRRSEQLIKSLLSVSADPIVIRNAAQKVLFANEAFSRVFGWSREEVIGRVLDLLPEDLRSQTGPDGLLSEVKPGRSVAGWRTERLARDGRRIPVAVSEASVFDQSGRPVETLTIYRDISAEMEAARALQEAFELQKELADRDALTGLLNHRCLHEVIERELEMARRQGGFVSLMILDLDRFKRLNDTFGHLVGDEALKFAAEVMRRACRTTDLVGRYGGDEFMIVLPQTNAEGARLLAGRLGDELSGRPFVAGETEVELSASMGVATYPLHATGLSQLIDQADRAMYRAKAASGRNVVAAAGIPGLPLGQPRDVQGLLDLVAALDHRDHYSRRHAEKMAEYAAALGRSLGFDESGLERLERAALVHDVGNIYISEDILLKPGPLADQEREVVRRHPLHSQSLLKAAGERDAEVLEAVLHHHERFDGLGYPHRFQGKKISFLARILAVADVASAMSLERPYRRRVFNREEIRRELSNQAGRALDPDLVAKFLNIF